MYILRDFVRNKVEGKINSELLCGRNPVAPLRVKILKNINKY